MMDTASLPAPVDSCVVYTPPDLASALVSALVRGARASSLSWLEPSVGSGVFLQALAEQGVGRERIVALDLEPSPTPNDRLARTLRPTDFIHWARRTEARFDRIVANPPFVAVRALPQILRDEVLQLATPDGVPVPHRANYWYAFLNASLALLRPGGSLGFVLPAAWCYANYARPLRASMSRWFREISVYRSKRPLFDVQDGSVVLLASGFQRGPGTLAERTFEEPAQLLDALRAYRPTSRREARVRLLEACPQESERVPLDEVLSVRIGAVTGDARFFLMTDEQRRARGLPAAACRPVVSRSRHLVGAYLDRQTWEVLRDQGERVWLFCPPPSLLEHPGVQAYLDAPPDAGGCRRDNLKLRRRGDLWFRPPLPRVPDGFMSGMSRHWPWIAFRCMDKLTANNTLYTVHFRRPLSREMKAAWGLMLLTSDVRRQLASLVRCYPDGLAKVEPGDLSKLSLPFPGCPGDILGIYQRAVGCLVSGKVEEAAALADRHIHG